MLVVEILERRKAGIYGTCEQLCCYTSTFDRNVVAAPKIIMGPISRLPREVSWLGLVLITSCGRSELLTLDVYVADGLPNQVDQGGTDGEAEHSGQAAGGATSGHPEAGSSQAEMPHMGGVGGQGHGGAPVQPSITPLAAASFHTCALLTGGRVKCWGDNSAGQLGLGDTKLRGDEPGQMGDDLPFVDLGAGVRAVSLAVGNGHSCALLEGGQIKCWGANLQGQLGLGDVKTSRGREPGEMGDALPTVNLGAGARAVAVVAGVEHTCALLEQGTVKCWGLNADGQLGLGDTKSRGYEPEQMGDGLPAVDLGTGARAMSISAGHMRTCAVLEDGKIKCWGLNLGGVLGLGDLESRGDEPGEMGDALPPVDLGAGLRATAVSAGKAQICAQLDGGRIKCWGDNSDGLGLGDKQTRGDQPGEMGDALPFVELGTGALVSRLICGGTHTCALLTDGRLKCWGDNHEAQLGLGDLECRGDEPGEMGDDLPAVELGANAEVTTLALGSDHSCAGLTGGTVKCWGDGFAGRLGLGDDSVRGDEPGEMGDDLPAVDLGASLAP